MDRYYKTELTKLNGKIEAADAEMKQITVKMTENRKLSEERNKLIGSLDSNFKVLQLEIEEIQSIEYPQDVDVEVMVEYFIAFFLFCS